MSLTKKEPPVWWKHKFVSLDHNNFDDPTAATKKTFDLLRSFSQVACLGTVPGLQSSVEVIPLSVCTYFKSEDLYLTGTGSMYRGAFHPAATKENK